MDKIEEAREILNLIGMPKEQQSDICCYVLLALAGITSEMSWKDATNKWLRIHDMVQFTNSNYKTAYAENSREAFRKKAIHHFRIAALIEDSGKSTNSPNYSYHITDEAIDLLKYYGTASWRSRCSKYIMNHQKLIDKYNLKRQRKMIPVKINGDDYKFSTGAHNELQKAILEKFVPVFAENSECLYVGDTTKKDLVKKIDKLKELGFEITLHDKMPDVVLYREDKDWLYFIEAVTSVGPMDPKRILEITEMTKDVIAGKIFVTAFLDFKTYKEFAEKLAWETEVWIAEMPEHMIHLNGDKFMGPR